MKVKVYKFTGLTSLLMANVQSINNKNLPQVKTGTQPNPGDFEKIAEAMTYRNADGHLCLPTQAFRSSLLKGSAGTKFAGARQSPRTIFAGTVFQAEDQAVLLDKKGKPVKEFEIQVDSGVNQATQSRIIVVRPRIPVWHTLIPFEIDEEFAPSNFSQFLKELERVWNRAGRMAGVGAWRPECEGRHGRYSVEEAKK